MTNFGWLARTLLGGVALGAFAGASAADELSALKTQLEALRAEMNEIKLTQQPFAPRRGKLISTRRGGSIFELDLPMRAEDALREFQGYAITITPTADLPTPVSEIRVSGEIRTRLRFFSEENNDEDAYQTAGIDLDADGVGPESGETLGYEDDYFVLTSRGRLRVDAHTETAVGEVGGIIRLQSTDGSDALMQIAWGYWKMTPDLELGGGYYDSLASIRAGLDWNGNGAVYSYTGLTNVKVSQFRLSYTGDNGLSLAASLERNTVGDLPAIAGSVMYKQESFFVTASAIWEEEVDETSTYVDTEDNWFVGAGAGIDLGERVHVEGAIGRGEGYDDASYVKGTTGENDYEFWVANAFADFKFGDGMKLQVSYSYADMDHEEDELGTDLFNDSVSTAQAFGAAVYWDPVKEPTLGVGASHVTREDNDGTEREDLVAGFGAWFRF
jgi:hypothetical protein